MFDPQLILQAHIALTAKQAGDPRYEQLVEAQMARMSMDRDDVEFKIALLARWVVCQTNN